MKETSTSRRSTKTKSFGSSRREGHDSSVFYARFESPETLLNDFEPSPIRKVDHIWVGDARNMDKCIGADASEKDLPDGSVALVVTSPPYFAGKEYELALGKEGIPASYSEYLEMLRDVFEQCLSKLEIGGRIAVNVANLGRKPYRSLSADVIGILQDLGFLLRGEVIWVKAEGQNGSCAWGSFRSASNPVLRDVTERIIVASKGSFSRGISATKRMATQQPYESTITRDAFLSYTTDKWEFPPESALRVGHPAPFPKELPQRLINLYTFKGDLVLDPFMGSGTTAIAALETCRSYAGFDMFPEYVEMARKRISATEAELNKGPIKVPGMDIPIAPRQDEIAEIADFLMRAVEQGARARQMAKDLLEVCGFKIIESPRKFREFGVEVDVQAESREGKQFLFDFSGAFSGDRTGLKQADTLWKALGKACVLHEGGMTVEIPFILLTTDKPSPGSSGDKALSTILGVHRPIFEVFELWNKRDCKSLWEMGQGNQNRLSLLADG